jgi:sialate O-acetylesterase
MRTNLERLLQMARSAGLLLALLPLVHAASLTISNVFGSHMVLQRGKPIPVWGWTDAGAAVTASFTGQANASATADAQGFFRVFFPALPASAEPAAITVCAGAGAACATLEDVLIGDVVLCAWKGGDSARRWRIQGRRAQLTHTLHALTATSQLLWSI